LQFLAFRPAATVSETLHAQSRTVQVGWPGRDFIETTFNTNPRL
jgi:hypothetical protein